MAFSFFKSKKEEKVEDDTQEKVQELPIEQVEVNEDQPRQVFSEESIAELAETIQSHGLLQPIIVRPIGDNKYQIIAGERRYRAIKKLNWQKIPAIVKKMDEKEVHDLLWSKVKEVNKQLTSYKAIKYMEIKKDEFVKTTTMKIKRYEELKKDK